MEVLDILKKLVSFNTINDNENNNIVKWIEKYLIKYGFKTNKLIDSSTGKMNLVAEIGENAILAFGGHLDTVDKTPDWTHNPFDLTVIDNLAYGLGVCDMKGGIVAILKTISNIDGSKLKNGLKLYFTFDEEIGFKGIQLLSEEKEEFPKYFILAEPTDLKPVIATKGAMDIVVTFLGKSAHSSTPDEGISAILMAHEFINDLQEFSEELKKETNDLFDIPYTTFNIGKINGGDAVNKVPNICIIEFDARTVNENHNIIIENKIKSILHNYNGKMEIKINVKVNINFDSTMIKKLEKICNSRSTAKNYVTEASFIKDTNAIILGPGPITAHQVDEHIEIDKLNKLVEIYTKIIEEYCC